jgi:hypothetical protein
MAAPPAKPSPSNQTVQQTSAADNDNKLSAAVAAAGTETSSVQLKAPPSYCCATTNNDNAAAAGASASSTASSATVLVPSYTSSESSESYIVAKELLNAGNFEEALSIIEQELETTKALLLSQHHQDVDVHPAIAPLHYLYGTTLLYSLEEAKDDGQDAAAMTTMVPAPLPEEEEQEDQEEEYEDDDDTKPAAGDEPNPWAHLPEPDSVVAAAAADSSEAPPVADDTEDMEIAWENFEVARHIVEKMLTQPGLDADMERKLKLYVDGRKILVYYLSRNFAHISTLACFSFCSPCIMQRFGTNHVTGGRLATNEWTIHFGHSGLLVVLGTAKDISGPMGSQNRRHSIQSGPDIPQ